MLYQLSYVRLAGAHDTTAVLRPLQGQWLMRGMVEEVISADDESTGRAGGSPPVEEVARLSIEHIRSGEEGQTMTEYVVVLGVITPVILLLFTSLLDPMAERLMELVGWLT